jgi:hypothetical protein
MDEYFKQGYKVCRISNDGTPISCTNLGRIIKYNKNEKTHRPHNCGAIAVFKNQYNAFDFAQKEFCPEPVAVFRCKYKPSEDKLYIIVRDVIKKSVIGLPKGTDFADWVILRWEE